MAGRPGPAHGALVRSFDDPAALRAALFRAGRAVLPLCRPPGTRKRRRPRRRRSLPGGARARRGRIADHRLAGQPRRGSAPAAADLRLGVAASAAHRRAVSGRRADSRNGCASGRRRGRRHGRETPILVRRPEEKYDAFAASRAALAASGSVALELAMARLPMVVGYRLNPLTEAVLQRVVKVRQVNLVNLLLGRAVGLRAARARLHPRAPRRFARRARSVTNGFAQRTGGGMMRPSDASRAMGYRRASGPPTRSWSSSHTPVRRFSIHSTQECTMTMTDVAETSKTVPTPISSAFCIR